MEVRQLTFGPYGHTLNRRQAISYDGCWALYDTRNDDTHIARTSSIERVHLESGEIVGVYSTAYASEYGPGVGAVACHPNQPIAIFIHGLANCSATLPYSVSRRFGAIVHYEQANGISIAESRQVNDRMMKYGTLHGGTHAHSWNRRNWVSYTYNDCLLESPRTVGFMIPKADSLTDSPTSHFDDCENFEGTMHAFLAAQLTLSAKPGSDEIEQAVEECWLGTTDAIAFQGTVRDSRGNPHKEVFLVELPPESELVQRIDSVPVNALDRLQSVPGCYQRRLTHTLDHKFPGLQGPRNWLVASPDGAFVYYLARDNRQTVQLFRVSTQPCGNVQNQIEQMTDLEFSIEGQISLDPTGLLCVFVCDQRLCLVDTRTGAYEWLTERNDNTLDGAVHFAGQNRLVFNAYVGSDLNRYLQIFVGSRD